MKPDPPRFHARDRRCNHATDLNRRDERPHARASVTNVPRKRLQVNPDLANRQIRDPSRRVYAALPRDRRRSMHGRSREVQDAAHPNGRYKWHTLEMD